MIALYILGIVGFSLICAGICKLRKKEADANFARGYNLGRYSLERDFPPPPDCWTITHNVSDKERIAEAKRNRRHLLDHIDEKTLKILEWHFGTHLPCFQGVPGKFDALDAMKRDAQREVILFLRQQLELAKHELKKDND